MAEMFTFKGLTPEQRRRKIAKLSRNPGDRSRIPTQYLPDQYKQARATAQRRAAPIMPGSTTTMGTVEDYARADVSREYAQPEQEMRAAIGQSQRQSRALPGWYDSYRKDVEAAAARQAEANRQITEALTQGAAQTQANVNQAAQADVAKLQADAATRGTTVNPEVLQRALAAARSGNESQNIITAGDSQAANTRTQLFNAQSANVGLAKAEALGRENRTYQDLLGQERALAEKKGAALSAKTGEILNRERSSELEQKAFGLNEAKTAAELALEKMKLKQSAADASFERRVKLRELQLRRQGLDADKAHDQAMEEIGRTNATTAQQRANQANQPKAPKSVKEAADNRKYRANITGNLADRIKNDATKRGLNLKDPGQRRKYVATLKKGGSTRDWFTTPYGDALVTAALDYAALGRIHPNTVRELRRLGLVITTKGAYGGPGAKS